MVSTRNAFFALLVAFLAGGVRSEDQQAAVINPQDVVPKKIVGPNDLVVVKADGSNVPAKFATGLKAYGYLSMGCTVTHIGNGLALTAGHCFLDQGQKVRDKSCAGTTVKWGYFADKAPYLTGNCVKILAGELSSSRDYAIISVNPRPAASIGIDARARSADNTLLTMFGHPNGRPLEWSQYCRLESTSTDAGNLPGSGQFGHQCDTEPGNSGSSILADNSNLIIGIHDGGAHQTPDGTWNYGTYLSDTPILEFVGRDSGPGAPTPSPSSAPTPAPTNPPSTCRYSPWICCTFFGEC